MRALSIALLLSCLPLCAALADDWTLIDDFDTITEAWAPEMDLREKMWSTDENPHEGNLSMRVDTAPQWGGKIVRASFGRTISPWHLSLDSRVRFWLYGDPTAHPTSSCLIFVESGGRQGGGDAHWLFSLPLDSYHTPRWQQIELPPMGEATQASWSVDADGKLDPARIAGILLVVQQNAEPENNQPFHFYIDDIEATNVIKVPDRSVDASNDSTPRQIRPKIRGFIDRERAHAPQLTFDDVAGWRVELLSGAEAEFVRSEEEPLFGKYTARLRYKGAGGGSGVEIIPANPPEITQFVDTVSLWVFGNNWAWAPKPDTPPVEVSVRLIDARGQNCVVSLGPVNWRFWFLMHKRIQWPEAWLKDRLQSRLPLRLAGIRITGMGNTDWREIYLDSVSLYEDPMELPEFNADLTNLPFPTRPDTILPDVKQPATNSVQREGDRFILTAQGDEAVTYTYEPGDGTLSGLTVSVAGREPFKPLAHAGPVLRFGESNYSVGTDAVQSTLVSASVDANTVNTAWRFTTPGGSVDYSLALEIKQKSLLITWDSPQANTEIINLGRAAGLTDAKLIHIPYLAVTDGEQWGVVWNEGTWLSAIPDWYVTNATRFGGARTPAGDGEITYAGTLFYEAMTDGTRNPVHDRIFLTASSDFDEILPNIPNPGPFRTEILRTHLYTHYGGISGDRFDRWLDILKRYKQYGIDHILVTHHEDTWTEGADVGQGPQEYTMTLDAAPDMGGDEKLKWYMAEVKKLGYFVGPYTNYVDFSPNAANWEEKNVARLANGDWHASWPQTWRIRPLKAVEMSEYYAPRIVEKFGANTCYNDVHTCLPLWGTMDYQAGSPGAAMLRTTFNAYGKLLMQQRESYGGPVFSEGGYHWYYAGLIDGSYAQIRLPEREKLPLMPDFDLRKMHPLSADISMLPGYMYTGSLHQSLAATIAYGHIGFLPGGNLEHACKVYYMVQPLQERYVHVPVDRIEYWDGEGWQTASTAYPSGVVERRQLRVTYTNGLEIWVNYNAEDDWSVECGGEEYVLPPYGWVARLGDEFLEFSALINGKRVDYMRGPQREYADTFGETLSVGRVTTNGPVIVRDDMGQAPTLIPVRDDVQATLN